MEIRFQIWNKSEKDHFTDYNSENYLKEDEIQKMVGKESCLFMVEHAKLMGYGLWEKDDMNYLCYDYDYCKG